MRNRSRALNAGLIVAGLGLVGAVARALAVSSAPLPRWDLLVCLLLGMVGVGGCFLAVRRGPFPEGGGVGTRKYWWPEQRSGWMGFGLFAAIVPVAIVAYAAISPSPKAWQMVEAGHTIRAVEVQEVLASKFVKQQRSGHYDNEVRVSVSFDSGRVLVEDDYVSGHPAEVGDKVWALYAPSSTRLGADIDSDRGVLLQQVGGPAQKPILLMVVGWVAGCLLLAVGGGGVAGPVRRMRALRQGHARSLYVSVTGVDVALDLRPPKGSEPDRPKPCLRLEGDNGEVLDLFVDRLVDPVSLGRAITGSHAKLYWGPEPREQPHRASAAHAVLVLDGEHYLRGWMETHNGAILPEGTPVPAGKELPEGSSLRAVRTFPVWDPALHSGGLGTLLFGLAALAMTTLGVGNKATVALAVVAYLSTVVAWGSVASRRTRYLRSFLQDTATSQPAP